MLYFIATISFCFVCIYGLLVTSLARIYIDFTCFPFTPVLAAVLLDYFACFFIYQEPTDIPSRKKLMRLVCQKREFTVRSSSCEVYPKLKNSI